MDLGSLYPSIRSVDESPVFTQTPVKATFDSRSAELLPVALVKIRPPQSLEKDVLKGIGHTLSQLTELGLSCVIVVDPGIDAVQQKHYDIHTAGKQADSLVAAIDGHGGQGARRLDSVLQTIPLKHQLKASSKVRGDIRITNRDHILAPLRRGLIPVIAPIAFDVDSLLLRPVAANEILLA